MTGAAIDRLEVEDGQFLGAIEAGDASVAIAAPVDAEIDRSSLNYQIGKLQKRASEEANDRVDGRAVADGAGANHGPNGEGGRP